MRIYSTYLTHLELRTAVENVCALLIKCVCDKTYQKYPTEDHPPLLRMSQIGTEAALAFEVAAALVLCGLNLSIDSSICHGLTYPSRYSVSRNSMMWFHIADEKFCFIPSKWFCLIYVCSQMIKNTQCFISRKSMQNN